MAFSDQALFDKVTLLSQQVEIARKEAAEKAARKATNSESSDETNCGKKGSGAKPCTCTKDENDRMAEKVEDITDLSAVKPTRIATTTEEKHWSTSVLSGFFDFMAGLAG